MRQLYTIGRGQRAQCGQGGPGSQERGPPVECSQGAQERIGLRRHFDAVQAFRELDGLGDSDCDDDGRASHFEISQRGVAH